MFAFDDRSGFDIAGDGGVCAGDSDFDVVDVDLGGDGAVQFQFAVEVEDAVAVGVEAGVSDVEGEGDQVGVRIEDGLVLGVCLLYTSPSPRD